MPSISIELAEQPGQRRAFASVAAVKGRVLGDQDYLANTALGQRPGFTHDRLDRAAAVMATQRRDDAERAFVIAAFGDLDVGEMSRRREDARFGVVQISWKGSSGDCGLGIGDW